VLLFKGFEVDLDAVDTLNSVLLAYDIVDHLVLDEVELLQRVLFVVFQPGRVPWDVLVVDAGEEDQLLEGRQRGGQGKPIYETLM
jgi:hypothetical protein